MSPELVLQISPPLQVIMGNVEILPKDKKTRSALIGGVSSLLLDPDILPFPAEYGPNISKFLKLLEEDEVKLFFSKFKDSISEATSYHEDAIMHLHRHSVEWKKDLVKSNRETVLNSLNKFAKKKENGTEDSSVDKSSESSGDST